ncbi:hypothetical protein, variant 5 [Aphanomyces astaci]|uniref:Fanconi-associated nuclease n=1 Tax=Aphanomyces astaci TaxID=112090 RepID=W4GB57_APHAT|nr:hypothetical protein, variant 5 [Aphanomyces astaci]ETV76905.1 hypothetical protein, variant 5 [Aphanomyces astaci]|eukprot:XP_009833817.1 hypothetical protein, variant 5 [Aphanomyces astaci]
MSDAVAAADAVDPSADEVGGIDEEIKEDRANAYVEHFVHIVQSTKTLFPTLLDADEHAAIDTYLALPAAAQLVYSRLFQRKGPWFRTTSLSAIADHLHPDPESSVPPLQTALRALETASFIRRCPKDSRVQVEIRRSIQNQARHAGAASGVRHDAAPHRWLLPPLVHTSLTSFDAPDLSSPHRQHRVHDPTSLTLFQIHPRTRDAFYRMHRLMYMTLSLPVQPTLKRATWGDWQRAVCRYEPTAWPGLLVIFGKVAAFPRVTLAAPSRPLFPTLHALMAYECASVLRHATRLIVDGVRLDHLLPSSARGLTADWLDVRPPTLLAFAGAASPSITSSSFSSSQPTKADFCDNVHAFLQSVDNMDSFVGELRACLASSLHLTREDDKQRRVFLEPYDATYALARSMDLVVGVYEKLGEYDKALVLLQELLATSVLGHKRGSWYTRLAINLEMHMKQPTDARAVCDTALSDPRVFPADRMDLLRRHRRLAKTPTTEDKEVVVEGCYPTHTIDGRPLNRAVGEKSRFIGYDDDSVTVEALVLQHYKSQGWHGAHDEGASFRSLLGLLLWDVMFLNDVPDVFQTPFQSRPLDMDMRYSDHFYNARAAAIDAVVMKLRASSALDLCAWIAATWHAHQDQYEIG